MQILVTETLSLDDFYFLPLLQAYILSMSFTITLMIKKSKGKQKSNPRRFSQKSCVLLK